MKILKSREVQIGILLVFILSLAIWGFNFLKGKNILSAQGYYYCSFEQVGGLMESNFVVVQGFKVGLVEKIKLEDTKNGRRIVVRIILDNELQVPKDSRAELASLDILGTKAINLVLGTGDSFYSTGDTLPSSIQKDMLTGIKEEAGPVVDKLDIILARIDSIAQGVQSTFSDENQENIAAIISNLETTTHRINNLLKQKGDEIGSIINSIDSITSSIEQEKESITAMLRNVEAITDSLSQVDFALLMNDVAGAVDNLNRVLEKINESEGSLGLLVNDSSLYENLNGATKSLDNLLIDLKRKPARYAHLSLIDWGKDVYIDDEGEAIKVDDKLQLKFGILVKMSESKVEIINDNFFDYKLVNEREKKGKYYYFYGFYTDYHSAKDELKTVQTDYPNAEVIGLDSKKIYFFE